MRLYSLSVVAVLFSASLAAHAYSIGDTVTCLQANQNSVLTCASTLAMVGSGAEFQLTDVYGTVTEDFRATDLLLTFEDTTPFTYSDIQNSDLTSPFANYSVLGITGFSGLSASNVSLTGGLLSINLAGSQAASGATIDIALQAGPVTPTSTTPELSSFALLGTGLLGVAGVIRKRLA